MKTERSSARFFSANRMSHLLRLVVTNSVLLIALMANGQTRHVPPRSTPLGTPVIDLPQPPTAPVVSRPSGPVEPIAQLLQRARDEHKTVALSQIADSFAEGTITYFGGSKPKSTFPLTVLHKGDKVQRIVKQPSGEVRQGSDGTRTWNAFQGFRPAAEGSPLYFIESQTSRSPGSLLDQKPGSVIRDAGMKGDVRSVELEDSQKSKPAITSTRERRVSKGLNSSWVKAKASLVGQQSRCSRLLNTPTFE